MRKIPQRMVHFIHSFIHRRDVDLTVRDKHCLKPLGYVSKQDGQNPCPLGAYLTGGGTEVKKLMHMCIYKVNDENNQEKKQSKRERERKGKRDQNCFFNNDQPVSSDEAYLSRRDNKMRGKAY